MLMRMWILNPHCFPSGFVRGWIYAANVLYRMFRREVAWPAHVFESVPGADRAAAGLPP